jgi:pilus assembly protein CpaB
MKPKTMILMILAVSCGLGASYMTSRLLADRNQAVEKITVPVARKNLNIGDTLKDPEDLFENKEFPKGNEPRLAILEVEKIKGRVLKRSLRAGDFITEDDMLDSKGGGGMHANMPKGHVAVGIRVNPESIAGGFASLPGSRVNVLWTVRRGNDRESFAKILLENVLVLAADQSTIRSENGTAMPANVVTVALKHEDSMKVELAKSVGSVSLVLRGFQDPTHSTASKITVEGLLKGGESFNEEPIDTAATPTPATPPAAAVPAAPAQPQQVAKEPTPPPAPEVVDKGPSGRLHTQSIYNGDKLEQAHFLINESSAPPSTPGTERAPALPAPSAAPAPKTNPTPDN